MYKNIVLEKCFWVHSSSTIIWMFWYSTDRKYWAEQVFYQTLEICTCICIMTFDTVSTNAVWNSCGAIQYESEIFNWYNVLYSVFCI